MMGAEGPQIVTTVNALASSSNATRAFDPVAKNGYRPKGRLNPDLDYNVSFVSSLQFFLGKDPGVLIPKRKLRSADFADSAD
jgi:hypothetical protein